MQVLDTITKAEVKNIPVGAIFIGSIGMAASELGSGLLNFLLTRYWTKWAAMNLNKRGDICRASVGGALACTIPQAKFLGDAFTKAFAIGNGVSPGSTGIARLIQLARGQSPYGVPYTPTPAAPPAPAPTPSEGPTIVAAGEAAEAAAKLLG